MNKIEKPKYVISPIDRNRESGNLTKGKKYELLPDPDNYHSERSFEILADDGRKCFCLFKNCSHILEQDWIIE